MAGRTQDDHGNDLMLADSQAASQLFGFGGQGLRNVPKSKFMFYARFHRARPSGGSDWQRGIGFVIKSIDRPKVAFEQVVLNQYNRKRVVQTHSEFDPILLKFHDTVGEQVQRMWEEYYSYYYNDPITFGLGNTLNDVITPDMDPTGPFGYRAPTDSYFFSHISVFQLFNGLISQFDLINPKIQQYNPDEMDYASNISHELSMTIAFEGIAYRDHVRLADHPDIIRDLGIDMAEFYDVDNGGLGPSPEETARLIQTPGSIDPFDQAGSILNRQLMRGLAGENVSLNTIGEDFLHSFDKNRGLVTAKLGTNALGDLVTGSESGSLDAVRKLPLYGKPWKIF